VNVDCVAHEGVNKVMDLDMYPRDLEDNSVDEIYCDNILEHLDFAKSTNELHRILKR
jgi:predicted SAM-dependent methyltransferase